MYVLYANVQCTMRSTQYILAREYRILQAGVQLEFGYPYYAHCTTNMHAFKYRV